MEQLLILLAGILIGYLLTGWKFARNANEIQRVEFFGKLYKVLKHDDPIFSKAEELDAWKNMVHDKWHHKSY